MKGKIVVITGSNSGIGKATAETIAAMGATVIMVCRDAQKGESARQEVIRKSGNEQVYLELCDFSRQASIHASGRAFREKYPRVDVLINNAGAIFNTRQLTEDGLEMSFAVNHIGYFLWTHYLLDSLRRGEMKRIVNVASLAHHFVLGGIPWDDLQLERRTYRQFSAYGLSKLCNVLFTKELAQKLKTENSGITVNCLHPGTVGSNFGSASSPLLNRMMGWIRPLLKTPETGAKTSVYLATSPEVEQVTGGYFDRCRQKKTSRLAADPANARRLWDMSMELTGLKDYGTIE